MHVTASEAVFIVDMPRLAYEDAIAAGHLAGPAKLDGGPPVFDEPGLMALFVFARLRDGGTAADAAGRIAAAVPGMLRSPRAATGLRFECVPGGPRLSAAGHGAVAPNGRGGVLVHTGELRAHLMDRFIRLTALQSAA